VKGLLNKEYQLVSVREVLAVDQGFAATCKVGARQIAFTDIESERPPHPFIV